MKNRTVMSCTARCGQYELLVLKNCELKEKVEELEKNESVYNYEMQFLTNKNNELKEKVALLEDKVKAFEKISEERILDKVKIAKLEIALIEMSKLIK